MADRSWSDIRKSIAQLGRAEVRVGIVGPEANEKHQDSDLTLIELAIIHEYGSPRANLPERSFIRAALAEPATKIELESLYKHVCKEVIAGRMGRDHALRAIGGWAAAKIRQFILDKKVTPPLRPATIAAKGHDVPLIDSRELLEAIGWDLNK